MNMIIHELYNLYIDKLFISIDRREASSGVTLHYLFLIFNTHLVTVGLFEKR